MPNGIWNAYANGCDAIYISGLSSFALLVKIPFLKSHSQTSSSQSVIENFNLPRFNNFQTILFVELCHIFILFSINSFTLSL